MAGRAKRIPIYPVRTLLFRVYTRFFFKPLSKKEKNLKELLDKVPLIYAETNRKGIAEYFSDECVKDIQLHSPDFILRFGFSIIRGSILNVCPFGIWSFHHDDPSVFRGVPSNFWEIYHGKTTNGAILQRLNETVDQGDILWQAWFPVIHHSWKNNMDEAYFQSSLWPAQVCRKIANKQNIEIQTDGQKGVLKKVPVNQQMFYFVLLLMYNRFLYHYRRFYRREMWISGIRFINEEKICWLPKGKASEYKADAFAFKTIKNYYVLYEHFDYRNPKGIIRMQKLDKYLFPVGDAKTVIEEDGHLAFPYTLHYNGDVYCCPESSSESVLRLYKFNRKIESFEFHCTLLAGHAAVDPVLYFHEGLWWLFFTEKSHSTSELHIWYSVSLEGPYEPHILNPVKTDVRSSRPAGALFFQNGNLYRPAQDCSKYSGHRIAINRIVELNTISFAEVLEDYIEADMHKNYNKGIHTWHRFDEVVSFDCKRHGR